MEIKRIVVCGDSFCAAAPTLPGTHFSELLTSKYNYEVVNLSRPGTSNVSICFQIEQAIKLNADFVIFANTDVSRIDIPIKSYQSGLGIANFDSNIYSNTIPSFINGRSDVIDKFPNYKELLTAIKYYVNFLFDYGLNAEVNEWMIKYWVSVLEQKRINYLWINKHPMWDIVNKYVIENSDKIGDCTYHTDSITQVNLADKVKKYIDNL